MSDPVMAEKMGISREMLLRSPEAAGVKMVMGDGNEWIIPTWRFLKTRPKMAAAYVDESGAFRVPKEFEPEIQKGFEILLELWLSGEMDTQSPEALDGVFYMMLAALRQNYPDLTAEIADEIGLINSGLVSDFLSAMAGLKKNGTSHNGSVSISSSPELMEKA